MRTVSFDIESFYSKKLRYTLTSLIAETYCKHELFDPYLLSVYDGSEKWVGHPKNFNWSALEGTRGVAHNAYFDLTVLNEMHHRGMCPKPGFAETHCTANMSAYLCNRRPLAGALEKLMGIEVDKSARSDANGKRFPKDFSDAEQKVMLEYAQNDAIHTWNLWDKFNGQWPDVEKRLSQITIEQGMRGVQINVDLLNQYIMQTHDVKMATEKQLPWLKDDGDDDESWDGFNTKPTSSKCVAEMCRRSGIPCPPLKSEDAEGFELWEATYSPAHKWIVALGAWRSINKLYKTFLVMKDRLRPDGTMPFALLYFGAHTGRWSGTAKINFQNMRKKPVFIGHDRLTLTDEVFTDFCVSTREETGKYPAEVMWAIDFRALIMPRPGKKMILSDLAQIEPRVLAWLTGNTRLLDAVRNGVSIYEAFARDKMGWTGGDMKKQNKAGYALAKAQVLSLGYGAGWEKFILMAQTVAGLDITTEDPEFESKQNMRTGNIEQVSGWGKRSREIVRQFRADNPEIAGESGIWRSLENGLRSSVGEDFVVTLPSGRKLTYEKVRCERRMEADKETGLPKARSVYTALIGFKRTITYGGKLTENVTQACARDVFGEHVVALDKAGHTNLFSSHDEAILEVDNNVTAKDIQDIMSVTPEWLPNCPIGAEAKAVLHYEK